MKSYLDLIPIAAKVHKKQSRMTRICIILAVSLVTTIFGMADMEMRSQKLQSIRKNGNWHMAIKNISEEDEALIAARPDVEAASRYDALNYRLKDAYYLNSYNTVICGMDPEFLTGIMTAVPVTEGEFPSKEQEVALTKTAKTVLSVNIGDTVYLDTPSGVRLPFTVTGFVENTSMMLTKDAVGMMTSVQTLQEIRKTAGQAQGDYDHAYYVRLVENMRMKQTIQDIKEQYHLADEDVGLNVELLGSLGQSDDSYMQSLYLTAAVLFLIVLAAGILMIASSLNSNVSQRIEFFGMMRCLGASRKQIIRFVRLEALQWCKTAVPIGLLIGVVVVWGLCAVLRFLSPGLFQEMPVFDVSYISLVCGILAGGLTVLLAAQSPAKRAAKVSPLTAVSGAAAVFPAKKAANTRWFKVNTALGISHARSGKKNYLLMTGSFALSIVLFLTFSVAIDFMHHAIRPLQPYTPDLSVVSNDQTCSIDKSKLKEFQDNPAVKRVYGRMFAYQLPARTRGKEFTANLISYEEHQFGWARDSLLEGSVTDAQKNKDTVLVVSQSDKEGKVGSQIMLNIGGTEKEVEVSGILKSSPFDGEAGSEVLICSEDTFRELTGEQGYTILDLQLRKQASDSDVDAMRKLAGEGVIFSDQRSKNAEARGAYLSFALFLYGFLAVIVLITIFNIVNSVAMSVSARMKQYGAMRAIGMSDAQLVKMIMAEALTYAVSGSVAGCILGIPLNRFLFKMMVASRWGDPWTVPVIEMTVIIVLVIATSVIAVYGPARKIHEMSITRTINAQ